MSLTIDQFLDAFADINFYGLKAVQFFNAAVNEGKAFIYTYSSAKNGLDVASPMTVFLQTPNSDELSYMDIVVSLASGGLFELFEDNGNTSDFNVSGGTDAVVRNRNRNFPDNSSLIVKTSPTITTLTNNVRLIDFRLGSRRVGGNIGATDGVLKANTKYVIRLSTNNDNNEGTIALNWYEAIKRV